MCTCVMSLMVVIQWCEKVTCTVYIRTSGTGGEAMLSQWWSLENSSGEVITHAKVVYVLGELCMLAAKKNFSPKCM